MPGGKVIIMYRYLLFDLDGTLTESGEGIMNAAAYAFKAMGRAVPDEDRLRAFVGPSLKESFSLYDMNEKQIDEAIRQFRVYFADRGWCENRPYPGIPELCEKLCGRGYTMMVATSKLESQAVRIVKHFGLEPFFEATVGSDDITRSGKADVVRYVLNKYDISPSEAVMIGDRFYDVKGAAACGLKTIGVAYGYGTRQELLDAGALTVADTVNELGRILGV